MTIVKLPGKRITLECNVCKVELDMDYIDHTLGFKEMVEDAKETYDWTVKKKEDEWVHLCENCSEGVKND